MKSCLPRGVRLRRKQLVTLGVPGPWPGTTGVLVGFVMPFDFHAFWLAVHCVASEVYVEVFLQGPRRVDLV